MIIIDVGVHDVLKHPAGSHRSGSAPFWPFLVSFPDSSADLAAIPVPPQNSKLKLPWWLQHCWSTIIGSNEDEGFHLRRVRHQNALPRRHTEPPGRKDRRRPAVSSHGWWVRGGVFPRLLISAAFSLQRSLQHLQTWGETEVGGLSFRCLISWSTTSIRLCLTALVSRGERGILGDCGHYTVMGCPLQSTGGSRLVIPTRRNHFSVVAHPVM